MDVFAVHRGLIDDYRTFTSAYVDVRDPKIKDHVNTLIERGEQWPDPWISLNPNFESGGTVGDLVHAGVLHPECERIFRRKKDLADIGAESITLYRHQHEAIEAAQAGSAYVLTTGTGSGKSLAYLIPIVDRVLKLGPRRGVKAIVVYPMNALANSQLGEMEKFLRYGYGKGHEPVTFARYTGQESQADRVQVLRNPPDILLTNYVMLDLVLTRPEERKDLIRASRGLEFLVLDELHTYRGRQGADVAMLVRRVRDACESPNLQCVGTSATMATGSPSEARATVVDVATRVFGAAVTADRVIGETLRRSTASGEPTAEDLLESVRREPPTVYEQLVDDPLARWIESTFGLAVDSESGRLVRGNPVTVDDAASQLAARIDENVDTCAIAIRRTLLAGSRTRDATNRPLFAFRLHQFLSKGDTVYVSLEDEGQRYITSQYQIAVPGAANKKLFPLAFCRECGQEYLVVSRAVDEEPARYDYRSERDAAGGATVAGYLYICAESPWPSDPVADARLPAEWVDEYGDVLSSQRKYLPVRVWVAPDGSEVDPGEGTLAAWVPTPFTFCLRCGVSYVQRRGQDFSKLATLGTEGRSSAMSLISEAIVRRLRALPKDQLDPEARKLLTFVDNRQDASLQAGHLNDFVQVAQLRGALCRAAADGELRHDDVAATVTDALGLDFASYAQNPEEKFSQKEATIRALRGVVAYRLYQDLERGWRVTMPNLEQVGLLQIDYADLPEIAADESCWEGTHHLLQDASPELRARLGGILADELRRVLAIDVDCLTSSGFERMVAQSRQKLDGLWRITDSEPRPVTGIAYPHAGRPGGKRRDLNLSGRSAFGRFLCQPGRFGPGRITSANAQEVIIDLLQVLEKYGILAETEREYGTGYLLKASSIIWRAGDGARGAEDPVRRVVDHERGARINPFFRDFYRDVAIELRGLRAAEHTAQVDAKRREEREAEFRDARLPLLYCSPTMELGVDIAGLNAVAMRNVPPTPANYAQRSGRAGRALEPALVVTYCSTGNAHDQYYFRRSQNMVAGAVAPPRLDLSNEDLIRSHVHAIWLAETGQHLYGRLTEILDVAGEAPTLELHPTVRNQLFDLDARRRATIRARAVLSMMAGDLIDTSWWTDGWVEDTVERAPTEFDHACQRWRDLYRAAMADQAEQNRLVRDQSVSSRERREAERRREQAEGQLRLLRNDDDDRGLSDFYPYRYLASEGFLPGYSFPRLPLAAYVPGVRARGAEGDYVQRPRFIAISEFGPGALLYHEGARYEVKRVQLPITPDGGGSVQTEEARRCVACGYDHLRQPGIDRCEYCGESLNAPLRGLLRLQTVFTVRRERISSDEEERRRAGFEIQTSYRFTDHGSRPGRLDATASTESSEPLAALSYGDSAMIRRINVGRRRRKDRENMGFWLDTIKAQWLAEKDAPDATPDDEGLEDISEAPTKQKVIPYVEDRRNILICRLEQSASPAVRVSLQYALERGIEAEFELEDRELESEELPDPHDRGRVLFTESAEGGAGVLRRLQREPDALARVARRALLITHFDPNTGTDLDHAEGATERCERGCYDCLLSYTNQLDHRHIDRHSIRDILLQLAGARVSESGPAGINRSDHLAKLHSLCDSELERKFLDFLATGDYRLPDDAQRLVPGAYAKPDFIYHLSEGDAAVFIDGPVHDASAVAERDLGAEERLVDSGWHVIRVRFDDEWPSVLAKHQSVFGGGRR